MNPFEFIILFSAPSVSREVSYSGGTLKVALPACR
jgi:hypothetical protein